MSEERRNRADDENERLQRLALEGARLNRAIHPEPYPAIPLPPPGQFAGSPVRIPNGLGRDRQPLYGLAVEEHDHALESLWQVVQELEQRLGPALTPPGPTGVQGGGQQQPVAALPPAALPPIVEQVNTQTKKVRLIESKLRGIADRVEV